LFCGILEQDDVGRTGSLAAWLLILVLLVCNGVDLFNLFSVVSFGTIAGTLMINLKILTIVVKIIASWLN